MHICMWSRITKRRRAVIACVLGQWSPLRRARSRAGVRDRLRGSHDQACHLPFSQSITNCPCRWWAHSSDAFPTLLVVQIFQTWEMNKKNQERKPGTLKCGAGSEGTGKSLIPEPPRSQARRRHVAGFHVRVSGRPSVVTFENGEQASPGDKSLALAALCSGRSCPFSGAHSCKPRPACCWDSPEAWCGAPSASSPVARAWAQPPGKSPQSLQGPSGATGLSLLSEPPCSATCHPSHCDFPWAGAPELNRPWGRSAAAPSLRVSVQLEAHVARGPGHPHHLFPSRIEAAGSEERAYWSWGSQQHPQP